MRMIQRIGRQLSSVGSVAHDECLYARWWFIQTVLERCVDVNIFIYIFIKNLFHQTCIFCSCDESTWEYIVEFTSICQYRINSETCGRLSHELAKWGLRGGFLLPIFLIRAPLQCLELAHTSTETGHSHRDTLHHIDYLLFIYESIDTRAEISFQNQFFQFSYPIVFIPVPNV